MNKKDWMGWNGYRQVWRHWNRTQVRTRKVWKVASRRPLNPKNSEASGILDGSED